MIFSFKGCAACEARYPGLRKAQERFSANGFSVLGVMVDKTVDTVHQAVATGDITWRCVWDSRSGPINKVFNVRHYPTLFLIDGAGRIVSTRPGREEELLASIEKVIEGHQGK